MRQTINMEIDPPARRVEPESLSSHLICIGQNISLSGADRTLLIQSILLSPTGQVAFRLNEPVTQQGLDLLASLGYEDLNSIAEDYTYKVCKQAYRIIDLMVACGELSFSDGNRLSKSIESCMKDGGFLVVYKPCKHS